MMSILIECVMPQNRCNFFAQVVENETFQWMTKGDVSKTQTQNWYAKVSRRKKIIDESQSYLENNGACNSHLKHFIFILGSTQCSEKDAYEYQSVKVAKCQPNLDHTMIISRYNPTQLVGYLHTHVNNPTNTQLQPIYQSNTESLQSTTTLTQSSSC
jgi:hypothetical protein